MSILLQAMRSTFLKLTQTGDGWERHVDRFLENYADEFLTIFEPNQMFAYGPVSQKLKEKIKDFGFTYFDKLGGV